MVNPALGLSPCKESEMSDASIEENVVIGKGGDRDLLVDIIQVRMNPQLSYEE